MEKEVLKLTPEEEKRWLYKYFPIFLKELGVKMKYPKPLIDKHKDTILCQRGNRYGEDPHPFVTEGHGLGVFLYGYTMYGMKIPYVHAVALSLLMKIYPWSKKSMGMYGQKMSYPSAWVSREYPNFKRVFDKLDALYEEERKANKKKAKKAN